VIRRGEAACERAGVSDQNSAPFSCGRNTTRYPLSLSLLLDIRPELPMAEKKVASQTTVLETLSSFVERVEGVLPRLDEKKIFLSTDLKIQAFKEDHGIRKMPVAWPLWDYKMFYIVDVPAGESVPKHSHDEAVFRVLLAGSLTVNGIKIEEPGTWWVVPSYCEYEINTDTGYKVLSAYTSICQTGRQQALRDKIQPPRG
jgi:hypothetical protein